MTLFYSTRYIKKKDNHYGFSLSMFDERICCDEIDRPLMSRAYEWF